MKKIIKEALPLERFTLPREEALALMKEKEGAVQGRAHRGSSGRCDHQLLQAG